VLVHSNIRGAAGPLFHVRPTAGVPIYSQITGQVKSRILSGSLRPGDQLPSVRELAVRLAVNPNTVARAYQELEREGWVRTERGRGTFVADRPPVDGRSARELVGEKMELLFREAQDLGLDRQTLEFLLRQKLDELWAGAGGADDRSDDGRT